MIRALPWASLALVALAAAAAAAPPPFVHLQTDKPMHRLGDTLWFRVHEPDPIEAPLPIVVSLLDPQGTVLAQETFSKRAKQDPLAGSFFLDPRWSGGDLRLRAEAAGVHVHEVALWVYDVARPQLRLAMRVLNDVHYPGEDLVATFQAADLEGRPLAGLPVRYRGRFAGRLLEGWAGPTDDEGRTVIRVPLPADLLGGGHLAAGVEREEERAAVSRPVQVSASVGRVDAFPEGGSVLPGAPQRMGLLIRDLDGRPLACEGRVVDDEGGCMGTFAADALGHALVEVPNEPGVRYAVRIDRPAGVTRSFPLPQDTGHPVALSLEERKGRLHVSVRSREPGEQLVVSLVTSERTRVNRVRTSSRGAHVKELEFAAGYQLEVGHVFVGDGKRTFLKAPVVLGSTWPLKVEVRVLPGQHLPRSLVELELVTVRQGRSVSADLALSVCHAGVTEDLREEPNAIGARRLLQPLLHGPMGDVPGLLGPEEEAAARRTAFVLVRGSYAFPPAGAPCTTQGITEPELGRAPAPAMRPRQPAPADPSGAPATRTRASGLDALLDRAHFTRAAPPRVHAAFGPGSSDAAPPGVGKPARRLPQEVKVGARQTDTRDTLFWSPRVRTDRKGRARIRLRLGDEVGLLRIACQGFSGGRPITGGAVSPRLEPQPSFSAEFGFPARVRVGDVFEVPVQLQVADGRRDPLAVRLSVPACLRPLARTELVIRPGRSALRHLFRFEAVSPAREAAVRLETVRGRFRERQEHRFVVGHAQPELSLSTRRAGQGTGEQSVSLRVPRDAIPGSVRVRARVTPATPAATAIEGVESLLRQPSGCFEQTTSRNYPNLVVLEALRDSGADAAVLARAHDLAHAGYRRLLCFQQASGGFALWPQGKETLRYTAMAVMQLAHYGRLFQGRGSRALWRALRWLERSKPKPQQAVYVALAVNEAGLPWSRRALALSAEPSTNYERALLANCLLSWQGPWPGERSREARLNELCAQLRAAQDPETGAIPSKGRGVMGSGWNQLTIETTALAAVALHGNSGRVPEGCLEFLTQARSPYGGWGGTQSTSLTIRALSRVWRPRLRAPVEVAFHATGAQPAETFVGGTRSRGASYERTLTAQPGSAIQLGVTLSADEPLAYSLGCSYRVTAPRSASDAPYRIRVQRPQQGHLGAVEQLSVEVELVGTKPAGQVVAQIALPGGCVVARDDLESIGSLVEVRQGHLIVYWEEAPERESFTVPMRGVAAGLFEAGVSAVYPYYTPTQVAYAPGGTFKVLREKPLMGTMGR